MEDTGYRPISCEFHDDLEAFATTRRRVRIYLGDSSPAGEFPAEDAVEGVIADIFTTPEKEEFLRLKDGGSAIRLDRIRAVLPMERSG